MKTNNDTLNKNYLNSMIKRVDNTIDISPFTEFQKESIMCKIAQRISIILLYN